MARFWSLRNAVLLSGLTMVARAGTTDCNNEEGCAHDSMVDSYVYCRGYRTCHDSSIDASYTVASGDLSNSYSDIESYYMYNYGRYSSYFANIKTILIENLGYYSASYADIKPYSSTLFAYFYGYYSGYYADVSCFDGDTCKVYCNNGGCEKLHFYCYANSVCHYDCSSESSYCPTLYASDAAEITSSIGTHDNFNKHVGLTDDAIEKYYNDNKISKGEESEILPDVSDKFKDNEKDLELKFDNVEDVEKVIIKEITEATEAITETKNNKNSKNNNNKNNNRNSENVARVFAVDAELSGDLVKGMEENNANINKNKDKGGLLSSIKWTQYMVACIVDLAIFILLFKAFTYIKNKRNVQLLLDLDERQQRAQIIDEEHYDLDYQNTHQRYYDNSNIHVHEQEAPIKQDEYSPLVRQIITC